MRINFYDIFLKQSTKGTSHKFDRILLKYLYFSLTSLLTPFFQKPASITKYNVFFQKQSFRKAKKSFRLRLSLLFTQKHSFLLLKYITLLCLVFFRLISVKTFRMMLSDTRVQLYRYGMENRSYLNFIQSQVYNSLVPFQSNGLQLQVRKMSEQFDGYDFLRFSRMYSFHEPTQLNSSQTAEDELEQQLSNGIQRQEENLEPIRSLSLKKAISSSEISFERDFIKEHASVFRENYQNYIEFLRKSTSIPQIKLIVSSLQTTTDLAPPTVASLLNSQLCRLPDKEKQQFLKDLIHEQKLSQFLHYVIKNCMDQDRLRLVLIARQVWMEFIPFQQNDYSIREIVRIGTQIAQKLIIGKQYASAQQEDFPEDDGISHNFSYFLKVYCCTVLLTIVEYFENPYFKEQGIKEDREEGIKRPYSLSLKLPVPDDDDLFSSPLPFKKRK